MTERALIVVDVQEDFMPGGALPAGDGYDVVPVINELMPSFEHVVATQDWHPDDHGSFASNHDGKDIGEVTELNGLDQILWPDHCIQNTSGAKFAEDLETAHFDDIFKKGTDPGIDSYSGFYDNGHKRSTGLDEHLSELGIETVIIAGIATDVCVKFTTLDACELGYDTKLLVDACRGVAQSPGDIEDAIGAMSAAGADILSYRKYL
jgi:nicotinamidase/pyrazinamidase